MRLKVKLPVRAYAELTEKGLGVTITIWGIEFYRNLVAPFSAELTKTGAMLDRVRQLLREGKVK